MINLSAHADLVEEKEKAEHSGFKVSFELRPNNPPCFDDSNYCGVISEIVPHSEGDLCS